MAKNNGKKFNTTLKETIEQEGMIRRLKGLSFALFKLKTLCLIKYVYFFPEAGLYDHNSSYYEQQQLDAVIQQSKEDAKRISKSDQEKDLSSEERVDLPAKRIPKLDQEKDLSSEERVDLPVEKVTGFEDDFHIVNDDDLTEITPKDTSSSTQKSGKKKPVWNEISDDEDDFFQTKGKADGALKIAAKPLLKNNASKLQKANLSSTDSQKVVPVESYGNKMVAASRKKSEDNTESPNSGRLFKSRRGDLIISPDEINDILSDKKSDTEDDDFVSGHPPPRQNKTINRNKTEQSNPGPKQKVAAMKVLCKKYSEMLIQIKNVPAFPFPEDPNFDSSVPRQQLIENEERLKASRSSNFDPIKWSKPIILSATNSRRRRPIFNQPSTSRRTPPEDAQVDSVDAVEIVCDSPPAASVRKLDISPSSPILKTRKRSDGSNGIPDTEMEVDRKSPIVIKEVFNIITAFIIDFHLKHSLCFYRIPQSARSVTSYFHSVPLR